MSLLLPFLHLSGSKLHWLCQNVACVTTLVTWFLTPWPAPHSSNSLFHKVMLVYYTSCVEPVPPLQGGAGGTGSGWPAEKRRKAFLLLELIYNPANSQAHNSRNCTEPRGCKWCRAPPPDSSSWRKTFYDEEGQQVSSIRSKRRNSQPVSKLKFCFGCSLETL